VSGGQEKRTERSWALIDWDVIVDEASESRGVSSIDQ
jgi:hypothetical protein